MREAWRRLYARYGDILRYMLIGLATTALSYLVFLLLNNVLGVYYMAAHVVSWVAGVSFAYGGNKWVVFRTGERRGRMMAREAALFVGSRLLTLGISSLLLYLLVEWVGMSEEIAKLGSQGVEIIANYVLGKLVVFRKY